MENEEWDALPGGAYTRGFIRTYASYLGLDGDRLADDYRRAMGPQGGERVPKRVEPVPTARRGRRPWVSGHIVIAAVCLLLVAAVVGIALAGGGGGSSSPSPAAGGEGKEGSSKQVRKAGAASKSGVAVRLAATAEVWVCLLDAKQDPLVDGQILNEGAEAGPFRSAGFEIALGNGSVTMFVDGKQADVPASANPVGYRVESGGKLVALEEGERPSCE
jgi:hypothetical protein